MRILNHALITILSIVYILHPTTAQASSCPKKFSAHQISEKEMKKIMKDAETNPNIHINTNVNLNMNMSGSKEDAILVFAIVGLIVVMAWIPYAIKYLYDLGNGDDYCPWYRLSFRHKQIMDSSKDFGSKRESTFSGVQLGIASLKRDYSGLGLAFEVGGHKIKDTIDNNQKTYSGTYFLMGPSIAIGEPDTQVYSVDLLGGSSTDSNIEFLAEAAFNWNINLNPHAREVAPTINLSFGASYIGLEQDEGIVGDKIDEYSLFFGIGFGFNF